MKIFVDENIPLITIKEIRSKGFEIIDIRGTREKGITVRCYGRGFKRKKAFWLRLTRDFLFIGMNLTTVF